MAAVYAFGFNEEAVSGEALLGPDGWPLPFGEDGRSQFALVGGTKVCDFYLSDNETDFIQGDLGSGKTRAMCARVMRHAQQQRVSTLTGKRMSRWAVVRNSNPVLKRSTIRTWLEMFPEHLYGRFNWGNPFFHNMRFDDVVLEVDFLGLDKAEDAHKLRSVEYTGIAFNEVPFIPREIVEESSSRLRYPGPEHGGSAWHGIIADGNAPPEDCWLALISGQVDLPPGLTDDERAEFKWPAGWQMFMQPPALLEAIDHNGRVTGYEVNPKAENLKNLPPGYYSKMIPGKSKAWIDCHLRNTVAMVVEGSPVWPMFRREFHVAPEVLRPVKGHEVRVALDFGRVYPAALFSQEINNRLNVQYEMLGFNEGATVFAPRVKKFLETHYPGYRVRFTGDPKGNDKGQATEQSSYDVFRALGMPVTAAPVPQNDIDRRIESVAFILNDNPSGVNRLVISPYCRTLIVGMSGRYHLVREADGVLRPKKDKYSNLCDCLQYECIASGEGRKMIGLRPIGNMAPARVYKPKSMRRIVA